MYYPWARYFTELLPIVIKFSFIVSLFAFSILALFEAFAEVPPV